VREEKDDVKHDGEKKATKERGKRRRAAEEKAVMLQASRGSLRRRGDCCKLVFVVFGFCISFCFAVFVCEACCMAFGTNASGEGDVAWSLTTLLETTGM
jgi:hypothetical protein